MHEPSFMESEWIKETHPNWYRDISPMRYLILGSFPPNPDRRVYPFYYPNLRNRFWKILADLADENLTWTRKDPDPAKAVEERFQIMQKLSVGVQNLGLEIERKGKSALDTHIRINQFHDIKAIMRCHPELKRILLPGFSAANSTARSFLRYLDEQKIKRSALPQIGPEASFEIDFEGKTIECVILNSTSTASKIKYDTLVAQFKKYLTHLLKWQPIST